MANVYLVSFKFVRLRFTNRTLAKSSITDLTYQAALKNYRKPLGASLSHGAGAQQMTDSRSEHDGFQRLTVPGKPPLPHSLTNDQSPKTPGVTNIW